MKGGRQEFESVGAMASESSFPHVESGVMTPTTSKVDAHQSSRRGDRHNNESAGRLALRPNAEILKMAKVFCAEKGYTLTELFEISVLRFIEVGAHHGEGVGAMTPLDDRRLMMKTDNNIINLYERYQRVFSPSMRWKPADDRVAQERGYNSIDLRVIELGIIHTQVQKLNSDASCKINSLRYFTGEIDLLADQDLSAGTLDEMLRAHRKTWERTTKKTLPVSVGQ